jgi:hypothetical protein
MRASSPGAHIVPRNVLRLPLFVLVCGFLAASQVFAGTARVELYGGTVSFVPPEGFSRLSDELVAAKFPAAQPGTIVYGNDRATVSISITHPPQQVLEPQQLPQFKPVMESFLEKQSKGLEWVKREIVEAGGRKWIHFELVTLAIDTKIHNHMYLTSRDNRMLIFNFNAPVDQYDAHRDALEQSRKSIVLK